MWPSCGASATLKLHSATVTQQKLMTQKQGEKNEFHLVTLPFTSSSYLFLFPPFLSSFLIFPTPLCLSRFEGRKSALVHKLQHQARGWSDSLCMETQREKETEELYTSALFPLISVFFFFCCWRRNLIVSSVFTSCLSASSSSTNLSLVLWWILELLWPSQLFYWWLLVS